MAYIAPADVPAGSTGASLAAIVALVRAAHSIKSVAGATGRAQAVADWPTLTGAAISAANPVIVYRQDTKELQISEDGSAWTTWENTTDSGWTPLTMASGYGANSTMHYRRRGREVELRGTIRGDGGTVPDATEATVLTLPAGVRPAVNQRFPTVGWVNGGADRFTRIEISPGGTVIVQNRSGSAVTGVHVAVHFLTD